MAWRTYKRIALLIATVVCLQTEAAKTQTKERPYALELRIECPRQTILVGDEIPIVFTITNKDTDPFTYDDPMRDRDWRWKLVAKRDDGRQAPDPRETNPPIVYGGLSIGPHVVQPGETHQETIRLNRWARITEAGRYTVVGVFTYSVRDIDGRPIEGIEQTKGIRVASPPIEIQVKPRSYRRMGQYIRDLTIHLKSLEGKQDEELQMERQNLVSRLAYTCDRRALPILIDCLYKDYNEQFEALLAFWCYLPRDGDVKAAVLAAARTRGVADNFGTILELLGCSEVEYAEIIRSSLLSNDPAIVAAAIITAGQHPADEHMPRLIAIALDQDPRMSGKWAYLGRLRAISAIAHNRTDDGIAALKIVLNDPDSDIRKTAADAIRDVYRRHPVYPEKVDEDYTAALVSVVAETRYFQHRYWAINEIARTRTPEGVKTVKMLLADPNGEVSLPKIDPGVQTIRDMLQDNDPNVRAYTRNYVETAYREYRGRPLRLGDFPPEFHEDPEARKKRLLQWLKAG